MDYLGILVALAPFIIICLASIVAAVLFIRKAIRNTVHRTRNIVLAIVFVMIPILLYTFLYVFGRVLTG